MRGGWRSLALLPRRELGSWPGDDEEPEHEAGAGDHERDEHDAFERATLLLDPPGAPHELPGVVDALGDRQRHEQREEHAGERAYDAGADRVGPVLHVRADPEPCHRLWAPDRDAEQDLDREQEPG